MREYKIKVPYKEVAQQLARHSTELRQFGDQEIVRVNKATEEYKKAINRIINSFKTFSQFITGGQFSKYESICRNVYSLWPELKKTIDEFHQKRKIKQQAERSRAARSAKNELRIAGIYIYLKKVKEKEIFVHRSQTGIWQAFSKVHKYIKRQFSYYRLLEIVPTVTAFLWLLGLPLLLNLRTLAILVGLGVVVVGAAILSQMWNTNVAEWFGITYGASALAFTSWVSSFNNTSQVNTLNSQASAQQREKDVQAALIPKVADSRAIVNATFGYIEGYDTSYVKLEQAGQEYRGKFIEQESRNLGNVTISLQDSHSNLTTGTTYFYSKFGQSAMSQSAVNLGLSTTAAQWNEATKYTIEPPKTKADYSELDKAFMWIDENINIAKWLIGGISRLTGKPEEDVTEAMEISGKALSNPLFFRPESLFKPKLLLGGEVPQTSVATPPNDFFLKKSIITESLDVRGRETHLNMISKKLSEYYTKELYRRQTTLL